jgi:hypothetical protein
MTDDKRLLHVPLHMNNCYDKDNMSKILCTSIFFYLVCEAIGTAATTDLLCQPWVILKMIVEKQMKCRLEGETEVL